MGERRAQGADLMKKGFNCAQSTLAAWAPDLGLERETALRVSSGFGGGMGRIQSVCGVVTGGVMAIGWKHGSSKEGDAAAKEKTYALVHEFVEEFKAARGTILCCELLGCDLNTDEGKKQYKDNDLFTRCVGLVEDAVAMLEKYL